MCSRHSGRNRLQVQLQGRAVNLNVIRCVSVRPLSAECESSVSAVLLGVARVWVIRLIAV